MKISEARDNEPLYVFVCPHTGVKMAVLWSQYGHVQFSRGTSCSRRAFRSFYGIKLDRDLRKAEKEDLKKKLAAVREVSRL